MQAAEHTDHTEPQDTPSPVESLPISSEDIARVLSIVRKAAGKPPREYRRKEGCKRSRQKSSSSQEWTRKNKKSREDSNKVSELEDNNDSEKDTSSPPRTQHKTRDIKTWLQDSKQP